MKTARTVAFQVLTEVYQKRAYTNLALKNALRHSELPTRDKALCTEIVYGTVQRERTLDVWLQALSSRPLRELDIRILTILRMTLYQLAFLDKIPAYAALNEAVNLAKSSLPKASGFVNGVLRSYLRQNQTLESRLEQLRSQALNTADAMGMVYSFPTWLVEALIVQFGEARAEQILAASNRRSELSLRVNPLQSDLMRVQAAILAETSVPGTPSPVSDCGVRAPRGLDVEAFLPYQEGAVSVQDDGAMLIVPLLRPQTHQRVLDMCAAPGTKTMQIAELQGDLGQVDACDVHVHKIKTIREAAARLHISSVQARLADARFLADDPALHGTYDAVLLDAPCSGFGVLRHRPDIRWRRGPEDVVRLQELQKALLVAAGRLVRRGGYIVYSTCTILAAENEILVQSVIDESEGQLQWDNMCEDLPESVHKYVAQDGHGLTLTPELFNTDGFYMARLIRV